jgi:hypothetical protein
VAQTCQQIGGAGSQHWYELQLRVRKLPHLHGEQKNLIVLRPGDELQTRSRWGQAMPWALTCAAKPEVTSSPLSILALGTDLPAAHPCNVSSGIRYLELNCLFF